MAAPIDRLLLETDTPVTYCRGTELEYEARPSDVLRTLNAVAKLKNEDKAVIANVILKNTREFFNLY